jgi:hypothetical protein
MMNTATRLMMTAAAASLALVPVVAQANTRAGDSGAVYSVGASAPGLGRSADGERAEGTSGILIGIIAAAAIIGGIVVVADGGDDDGQSPGR